MYIIKAETKQIEKIVNMSIRAFETDVNVGGIKGEYKADHHFCMRLRKAVPEAFDKGSDVCFDDVKIIVHPDSENRRLLRERQLEKNSGISRSRQKRLKKKRMIPA